MAKKRANRSTPQTSSIQTNTPIKGMIKDVDSAYMSKENWSHARNLANNSIDGDTGVVGNEPANLSCGVVPYTIIGAIHLYGDQWVLYSTDDVQSEIGRFDDSKCEYTTLINAPCLNFKKSHLIIGAAKENFDCTWQVYWDDNLNPSRTLNIDDIPYKQIIVSPEGDPCIIYEDTDELDCEKLRLHPLMDMACLKLEKAEEGGALLNGSYQAFIAYCDKAQVIGDYFTNSNITTIWTHENSNSSMVLTLEDIDTDFEFFKLVIRARIANAFVNYEFGTYSTETKKIPIDFIDPELPTVATTKLLLDNPVFEKSAGMFVVNDYLIRSQPTEYFDFNYQPLANQIETYWISAAFPSDYYKQGGNKPTFLRDEQYTFFIRFIYNTGEFSKSYHIPGRPPGLYTKLNGDTVSETGDVNGSNAIGDSEAYNYQVFNTAFPLTNADPFVDSLVGTFTSDGGEIVGGGKMGYWESTEKYPATQPDRYNSSAHDWSDPGTTEFDLCGKPIRHHKIPDETTPGGYTSLYNPTNDTIHVIGAAFDNIAPPVDNDGNLIENIVGYQILVGSRDGKKSIIAKGIIKNMMRFRKDRNDTESGTGLMPNYPYNDLRPDPYLLKRRQGTRFNEPWFAQMLGWDTTAEDNWMAGNQPITTGEPINSNQIYGAGRFDLRTYTFHSPDTNFTKVYLNPTEIKTYKEIHGEVLGRFKKVEGHTQHKLLKNRVVTLAAIYGIGYAIMKLRGERNYSTEGTRSYSVGETMVVGSGGSPTPVTGTALAAANAAILSGGLWGNTLLEWAQAGALDLLALTGGTSEANKAHATLTQQTQLIAAALSAGHIGPKWYMEQKDSEFNAVPAAGAFLSGILTFLNFLAIGGDKMIQLVLDLVSFQDYALKYISHGFYANEIVYSGYGIPDGQVRFGVDRARYIKQAVQSFDGNDVIQNVLRPSTVVVRHLDKIDGNSSYINFPVIGDNTKFTVGAGPCAGDGDQQLSWWDFGNYIRSTCSAQYVSLKNQIGNQYGQLDSIIQLPVWGCPTKFADQQKRDSFGNVLDIKPGDRFSTGPVFGGDSYIARYTEKTIMPFFYQFLKDDEERGYAFDYSRYANVPFPRYWMNTEKYRMDEFIRPITDLDFNWANALPDGLYNLDAPENGGYCQGNPGQLPPDGLGGGTLQNASTNSGIAGFATGQLSNIFTPPSAPPTGSPPPPAPDPNSPSYVSGAELQRYVVYTVGTGGGGAELDYSVQNNTTSVSVNGAIQNVTLVHPVNDVRDQLALAGLPNGDAELDVSLNISFEHGYNTPLANNNTVNSSIAVIGGAGCGNTSDRWENLTDGSKNLAHTGKLANAGGGTGVTFIFDWQTLTITNIVASSLAGNMYGSVTTTNPVPTTENLQDLNFRDDSYVFTDGGIFTCIYVKPAGMFDFTNGTNAGSNVNVNIMAQPAGQNPGSGTFDNAAQTGADNFAISPFNPQNTGPGGNQIPGDSGRAAGGLFVYKFGYIYTHNTGINDFWVETDLNLAYRDWEDEKRKRHYDNEEYTDLVELFHSKIIEFDNYYNYDKSVGVRRFWSVSFSKIQERWYDPNVAEQCFTQYPKRLIYSVPATGFLDKAKLQNKNDKAIDFWRVFLAENYRDFKSPVNAIVPFNQTGALMLFPTLSPKVFQGVDKLQLSQKKVLIGDGGLFSQVLQNAANSNVSHEYGSCESYRSVLNTPQGVYFVSQAQGKIFLYQAGRGLEPISDRGMKWWFNKFLPSQLLADFPNIEDCPQAVDNPVIAAGINTVYDPNDDIVYFCKRDYKINEDVRECIEYIPCEGFVYNATLCDGAHQIPVCPEGYVYIPAANNLVLPICQLTTTTPALVQQDEAEVDVVFVVDSSNSVEANGNVGGMINLISQIITGLEGAQNTPGEMRAGIVHFGAGRAAISDPNTAAGALRGFVSNGTTQDSMFNPNDQLAMQPLDTVHTQDLINYLNIQYTAALGVTDDPNGTDLLGGIWAGMNLLYGTNSRPGADKRLIILADGAHFTKSFGTNYKTYDGGGQFFDLHVNAGVPNPTTPDITINAGNDSTSAGGQGPIYTDFNGSPGAQWFRSNIILNQNYINQQTFFIGLDTKQGNPAFISTPNQNQQDYFSLFANAPGDPTSVAGTNYTFFGTVQDQNSINTIVDQLVANVIPDPTFYCPDPDCILVMQPNDPLLPATIPVCQCVDEVPPTFVDATYPIDLQNTQYFKDISWTVSYDPKSKAWISFHDWHPELTLNSINHFLTTKSQESDVPICPPNTTWNGEQCCETIFTQAPAQTIVNETEAIVNLVDSTMAGNKIDVVFAIDNTASTGFNSGQPGQTIQDLQLEFVKNIINNLDLASGNIQVAHGKWSAGSQTNVQALTNNAATAIAGLNTTNYDSTGGTDYRRAIFNANNLISGSTAETKIGVIITDAENGIGWSLNYDFDIFASTATFTALSPVPDFTGFDKILVVNVKSGQEPGFVGDGCGDEIWQRRIAPLLYRFYNPSVPFPQMGGPTSGMTDEAFNYPFIICNAPAQGANMFEVTSCTDPNTCNTHYQAVAEQISSSLVDCQCPPNTILDENPDNPDCSELLIPPQCIVNCECPPGYTLIGDCTNSANPPTCRSVDCECPPSQELGLPSGIVPTIEGDCSEDYIETINTNEGSIGSDGQVYFTNGGFNLTQEEMDEFGPCFHSDYFSYPAYPPPLGGGPSYISSDWGRGYKCATPPASCAKYLQTADTYPIQGDCNLGVSNAAFAFDFQPYEGTHYIGIAQTDKPNDVVSSEVPGDICCGSPGGLDSFTSPGYYQEGVWQRLLDSNGIPTTMVAGASYAGSVALAAHHFFAFNSTTGQYTFRLAQSFAPSLEIWGGMYEPGKQGENYRGYQFTSAEYPNGYDGQDSTEYGGPGSSELLWRSPPVENGQNLNTGEVGEGWQLYDYNFTPTKNWKYIFAKVQAVRVNDGLPTSMEGAGEPYQVYLYVDAFSTPVTPVENVFDVTITNSTICTYAGQECTDPNYISGGIWRHNVRTDLFANFYNVQYPWEVDLIETTGQTVNTLRSVEYHLESYLYSENQLDRFHDLDYNFDRAIIYNTEQISGLLNLVLSPKNNSPLAMQYPIINPNSIDILFSKEEQKYRFNQFFDITDDRGEFSGVTNQMFQTQLNGYIIDLNPVNLNYNKPQHQRKKFRHYYNHVVLRKSDEALMTRKMILRLENFKLNLSFR